MSYVRFGTDGSNVYVYGGEHSIVCSCCGLDGPSDHFSYTSIIKHLRKHQEYGHCVPDFVFKKLERDKKLYGDKYPLKRWQDEYLPTKE